MSNDDHVSKKIREIIFSKKAPSKDQVGIALWGDRHLATTKQPLGIEVQFALVQQTDLFVISALSSRRDLAEEVALFIIHGQMEHRDLICHNIASNSSISKFIAIELAGLGYAPYGYFKDKNFTDVYNSRYMALGSLEISKAILDKLLCKETLYEVGDQAGQKKLVEIFECLDLHLLKENLTAIETIYQDIKEMVFFVSNNLIF